MSRRKVAAPPPSAYPERLRKSRQRANLSQEELGKALGYTDRQAIAAHEAGKVDPSRDFLRKAAALLEVDPCWLGDLHSDGV